MFYVELSRRIWDRGLQSLLFRWRLLDLGRRGRRGLCLLGGLFGFFAVRSSLARRGVGEGGRGREEGGKREGEDSKKVNVNELIGYTFNTLE